MTRRATATEIPRQHADAWLAGRYAPPGARRDPLVVWTVAWIVVAIVQLEIGMMFWLLTEIAERIPR